MTPGERFKRWIESLADAWKDRLRGWMVDITVRGITGFIESIEPEAIDTVRSSLSKIVDNPQAPEEIKDIAQRITSGGAPIPLLLAVPLAVILFVPTIFSVAQPLANLLRYREERVLHTFRLDPLSVITAWRRDQTKYAGLFDDLKDQGWSDDRIKALQFLTLFYPGPADLVRWQAREVFEPTMIDKYGLDEEIDDIQREPFYKAGMTDEQIVNYWRAHWEHASWMQMVEMLHRGLIKEQDVYEWFRLVEIVPFWRDMLIQTAYTWPTRVDVRRWWDMRTIDEARLRELYSGMGYRGKNLDDYVLWTKVYVAFPDLLARWSNGWITEDDVRSELTGLGMPAARVEEMIQGKKKAVESAQVEDGKTLTKTEIYKGVKKGTLTRDQGIDLLMDLNYNVSQAEYLIDINVGALEGSPETYDEFKQLTTEYKIATGKEARPMPEELKRAGEEVVRLTNEVESLQQSVKDEEAKLIGVEPLPAEATARRDELRVALHRAEAELARVKTDYELRLAEWRRGV